MATVSQSGVYNLQSLTSVGALGVGMRLYTYTAGTTTHKTAYTDSAGAVAHTYTSDGSGGQYIAMDARGELPAPLYLTSGAYDLALKTAAGATVWTRQADPVGADLAASGGAASIGFLQSGTGAVSRTVQSKLREVVSVKDFGAVGDGVTDDTAAIQAALTAHNDVYMPAGLFNAGATLTLRSGQRLFGAGKYNTKIKKTFNGDLITAAAGISIEGIWFEGDGATRTGRGFVFDSSTPRAEIKSCRIVNFADYCIEFAAPDAGSLFTMSSTEIYRTTLTDPAIKCPVDTASAPRTFTDCYTTGGNFIDCGGADNVLINGCHINTLVFNTGKKVMLTGTRIATVGATLTFSGLDNTLVGCTIAGPVEVAGTAISMNMTGCIVAGSVTLLAGAQKCTISDNQCTGAVVDDSGNGTNKVDIGLTTYTPTWTTSGTAPSLGDGSVIGRYSRQGNIVKATIEFVAGSTTTFGTGEFRFSLPFTSAATVQQIGSARMLDSGNVYLVAVSVVQASRGYVIVHGHSTAGPVTSTSPFAWTTNDSLTLEITYSV